MESASVSGNIITDLKGLLQNAVLKHSNETVNSHLTSGYTYLIDS